ncbi:MAG: hypothetical protein ACKO2B_08070, partial [Betaproteobacteria bacterium]
MAQAAGSPFSFSVLISRGEVMLSKILVWIGLIVLGGPLFAQTTSSGPPVIGVVLLHGKQGHTQYDSTLTRVGGAMQSAGMLVIRPEMAWSWNRLMDKHWSDAVDEIKVHIEALRARGAQR